MPGKLDEEKIEEILDLYVDLEDAVAVADEAGVSQPTVRKYVGRAKEEGDPRAEGLDPSEALTGDDDWQGEVPGESPFGDEDAVDIDRNYTGMSPGDFIEQFFKDFEVGVKKKWVRLQARRADRRGMLPNKEAIKQDILRMKSGVNQSAHQEAGYIAEEFWAEAQNFLRQTGGQVDQAAMSNTQNGQRGWEPPGNVGMGGGQQGYATPPGGASQQPPGGGQMQMFQMMFQQMQQQMQQQMEALREDVQRGGQDESEETLQRKSREFLERKIEDYIENEGGSPDDEVVQQLAALRSELQGGQQGPPIADADDWRAQVITLVRSGNLDAEEATSLMEKMEGEDEPVEVVEKRLEKEMRELELDHQSDRVERIGETAETLFDRFGQSLGEAIVSGGSDEATGGESTETGADDAPENGSVDPAAATPATASQASDGGEPEECEHCGTQVIERGNQKACQGCEWGVGPCDLCTHPIEIPPIGEEDWGKCAECEHLIEIPDDETDAVSCDECEWEGEGADLRGTFVQCDGCENYRPIMRSEDVEAASDALADVTGD